jgi:hypothetical protein
MRSARALAEFLGRHPMANDDRSHDIQPARLVP